MHWWLRSCALTPATPCQRLSPAVGAGQGQGGRAPDLWTDHRDGSRTCINKGGLKVENDAASLNKSSRLLNEKPPLKFKGSAVPEAKPRPLPPGQLMIGWHQTDLSWSSVLWQQWVRAEWVRPALSPSLHFPPSFERDQHPLGMKSDQTKPMIQWKQISFAFSPKTDLEYPFGSLGFF